MRRETRDFRVNLLRRRIYILLIRSLLIRRTITMISGVLFLFRVHARRTNIPLSRPMHANNGIRRQSLRRIINGSLMHLRHRHNLFTIQILRPTITTRRITTRVPMVLVNKVYRRLFNIFRQRKLRRMMTLQMRTIHHLRRKRLLQNLRTLNSSKRIRPIHRVRRQLRSLRTLTTILLVRISRLRVRLSNVSINVLRRVRQKVPTTRVIRRRQRTLTIRSLGNIFRRLNILNRRNLNSLDRRGL